MTRRIRNMPSLLLLLTAVSIATAYAQAYRIDWHTVDGGGHMLSAGGDYVLSGTSGQSDAGPDTGSMTGGAYALEGGFWSVTRVCACLGDMNEDGVKDSLDIQQFVDCVLSGGNCYCADVNGMHGVTVDDMPVFVADLLGGSGCP